jgi:hypothetical protein
MQPLLIHPQTVTISQRDTSSTTWDDDALEPVLQVERGTAFNIRAQVVFADQNNPRFRSTGIGLTGKGYLIVRKRDLERMGKTVAFTDKITSIGEETVLYFVESVTNVVSHTRRSKAQRIYFTDKLPTKEA